MKTITLTFDYPPIIGGIANALATFYRRAGNDDSVILAPGLPGGKEFDEKYPIKTLRFPTIGGQGFAIKIFNFIFAFAFSIYYILTYRPKIFVAGQIIRAGPIAYFWHKLTGRPFYLWVYGGETSGSFTKNRLLIKFLHHILRSARVVFTNSPTTTKEMLDFNLPTERVVELPLGIDRKAYFPDKKDESYIKKLNLENKLIFLTLGRHVERKGHDMMLKAFKELSEDLPPWHYIIGGDGPYRDTLEKIVKDLDLTEHVTFTGYLVDHELPIYYKLCDVFAMPNREVFAAGKESFSVEGFGMVFIEAAACGKPVIAGRSGGAVNAVNDGANGLLVNPTDISDLKAAILKFVDPDCRKAMGDEGIKFSAPFSWEKSAKILSAYLGKEIK